MGVHEPVVAGSFYPAESDGLSRTVDGFLAKAPKIGGGAPKAVIMPHAGYRFSGATAAAAAAQLSPGPRRVVVIGPSHRHAFHGVAVSDMRAMATPLGQVPLDRATIDALLLDPDVSVIPEAFAREHSIEVELPFLQRCLTDFHLVPLVVGEISDARLAEIIGILWGGAETLIVVSTDLSHFMAAHAAQEIDGQTAAAIELIEPAKIGSDQACGHRPLSAFLTCADRRGLRLTRADLTHSGNISGDLERVVGYGAWLAHAPEDAELSPDHRAAALRLARQAMSSRARNGRPPVISLPSFPHPLQGYGAAFVSLTQQGRLRGCIGSLKAHRPLAEDILDNAVRAGFHDPRFHPVSVEELPDCHIEISLLSRPAPIQFTDEEDLKTQLVPGRDGLILESSGKRGTFLPKVWGSLDAPDKFLNGLKIKAGLQKDHWSGDIKLWRYMSEDFAEDLSAPTSIGAKGGK